MRDTPARLFVVTGIQASGKSTVARALAARFDHGVHIEADVLHGMIVTGGILPDGAGPVPYDAARQLRLRLHNAALLARSFREAGFTAVLDDIIIGDRLAHLREDLADVSFELIVLAPHVDAVIADRDPNRAKATIGPAAAHYLDAELRRTMAGIGRWIDTTNMSVSQTVDAILAT